MHLQICGDPPCQLLLFWPKRSRINPHSGTRDRSSPLRQGEGTIKGVSAHHKQKIGRILTRDTTLVGDRFQIHYLHIQHSTRTWMLMIKSSLSSCSSRRIANQRKLAYGWNRNRLLGSHSDLIDFTDSNIFELPRTLIGSIGWTESSGWECVPLKSTIKESSCWLSKRILSTDFLIDLILSTVLLDAS